MRAKLSKAAARYFSPLWCIKIGPLKIEKPGEPVLPNRFPIQGLGEEKNTQLPERPGHEKIPA